MMSFSGQASSAKMMSIGDKLTKRVNKAEELTYLSASIGSNKERGFILPRKYKTWKEVKLSKLLLKGVSYSPQCFHNPGPKVIKLFTAAIYKCW
jgi:hypothetical protein